MSLPQLRLDNQLCFLFHRITRELNAAYRPLLADLGLTYSQYLVMLCLWERDGLGVGELGDRLDLDSGTLSPLLRRLERARLVRRERATSDERRVTIYLTVGGRDLQERATGIPEAIAGCVVDDEAGYEAMKALLNALAARIALSRGDGSGVGRPGQEQGPRRAYAIPTARCAWLGTVETGISRDTEVEQPDDPRGAPEDKREEGDDNGADGVAHRHTS